MRSDFTNPDNAVVAGKAGMNDDPHHGHLDIGQFIVYWRNHFFISELGRLGYDQEIFNQSRYSYPQVSSEGHNLIFVNGEGQIPGKVWKQPFNYNIGGKVEEFRSSKNRDYALMDPTNAYKKTDLKGWRRHVTLEKPNITVVIDEVNSNSGAEIEQRFHSECGITINNRYTLLSEGENKMAIIPVNEGDFIMKKGRHSILPVNGTAVYKEVEYIGTFLKAKSEKTIMGAIILPVNDENEAQQIAASARRIMDGRGNLTFSFTKANKLYTYSYKKDKDGLRLENINVK
jgi:hypothetical protein